MTREIYNSIIKARKNKQHISDMTIGDDDI